MSNQIEALKSKLLEISQKKALLPEDLEFLAQSLTCKWYGIQVLAAKILSKFNPTEAKPILITWMQSHVDNKYMLHDAQKALIPCLAQEDISWILPLYFARPKSYRYFLIAVLVLFPTQSAIEQLVDDYRKNQNFETIIILSAVVNEGRERVLQNLVDDNVKETRIRTAFSWIPVSKEQLLKFKKPI